MKTVTIYVQPTITIRRCSPSEVRYASRMIRTAKAQGLMLSTSAAKIMTYRLSAGVSGRVPGLTGVRFTGSSGVPVAIRCFSARMYSSK